MKNMITYPHSKSLNSNLEIIDQALDPLFSELRFSSLSTQAHRCKAVIPCENLSLELVDQSLMLSSGAFSVDKQAIKNINIHWDGDCGPLTLQLQTQYCSNIEIIAPAKQSKKFWSIIRAMDSGLESITDIYDEGEHVCPCCQRREAFIEQATADHPVAMILKDLCQSADVVQFKLIDQANYADLILEPVDCHFEKGTAKVLAEQGEQLKINIASIHGVHILRESIDRETYSKLKLFNSFGKGFLELSVKGYSHLHKWATILDNMGQYRKSYSK